MRNIPPLLCLIIFVYFTGCTDSKSENENHDVSISMNWQSSFLDSSVYETSSTSDLSGESTDEKDYLYYTDGIYIPSSFNNTLSNEEIIKLVKSMLYCINQNDFNGFLKVSGEDSFIVNSLVPEAQIKTIKEYFPKYVNSLGSIDINKFEVISIKKQNGTIDRSERKDIAVLVDNYTIAFCYFYDEEHFYHYCYIDYYKKTDQS